MANDKRNWLYIYQSAGIHRLGTFLHILLQQPMVGIYPPTDKIGKFRIKDNF